jgi:cobalt-zinc-cadmium efflux system outer membrane protein
VEEPTTRLSIDQIINAVLVSDPRLRAGFQAINQAHASALTASLPPNPTMMADIQLLPLTRPFTVTDQGGPPQMDFQFSQPIDWWLFGKRAANMAREAMGVKVAESDYADRIRTRIADAASAYYDVVEAQALHELARQDVANLKRAQEATEKAVQAGSRPLLELRRIQLDRLTAERSVRDAEATLVNSKARLRAMIGRTDADPTFGLVADLDRPLTVESIPLEEAYEIAVRNRPDIESSRRRVAMAAADMEAQRRAAYPSVAPQFGYTRQFQKKAIGFPDADSWMAEVTMTLPLWDRNQGNRARAASVLTQAQFSLAGDLADLRADVTNTLKQLETARANSRAISDQQLQIAGEVLRGMIAAYTAGGRPLIDVLDAERNFRDTYRAYISTRAAYWRAVYRFQSAIGQKVPR